jgi:adenylyltransferase and sulfurtransferase
VRGTIGIADADRVDLSNLHRQVLYRTSSVGDYKVTCAEKSLKECGVFFLRLLIKIRLNPLLQVNTFESGITPSNAVSIVSKFGLVLDCTDAPSTRYLISDVCVALSKPLISGSALGTEGQIAVYCHKGGPCYRCIFPTPPPPETVLTCGEGGILGPGAPSNVLSPSTDV